MFPQQPPLAASADPLDRPLERQDPFFLEQTKKKGVKVRIRQKGVLGDRGQSAGLGSVQAVEPQRQSPTVL